MSEPPCSIVACDRPVIARGFCFKHYLRWRKHGDPHVTHARQPAKGAIADFIRSLPKNGEGCITWPFGASNGRGVMYFHGRHGTAARAICEIFHGPPPSSKHQAAHSCGRGHFGCVAPWHLGWAEPKANAFDKIAHGTALKGEKNHSTKLTASQVSEIRAAAGSGTQKQIGARYGIDRSTVSQILRGRTWQ